MATDSLNAKDLRVRMYRVGFGDCFLLSLPTGGDGDTHRHVLVDCGVHPQGNLGTMEQVLNDIGVVTGRKLALVVATHEHADHISGFGSRAEDFAKFDVGEVWMPWAMNDRDPQAVASRKRRLTMVDDLAKHFGAAGASAKAKAVIENLRGNDKALAVLRGGFAGAPKVRYFEAGMEPDAPRSLAGLSVRVLGPPRGAEFLRKMDPPPSQKYLHAGPGGKSVSDNAVHPFQKQWQVKPRAGRKAFGFSREDERSLRTSVVEALDLEALAFALDSAVNNTSLVLLFTFRTKLLLFPGDAQYGNWKAWLDDKGSALILPQISFLKVSHHGSFNATPRQALEAMTTGAFAAMASTQSKPWKSIPQPALMKRLEEKTGRRCVRSDSIPLAAALPGARRARLPSGFRSGPLWIDYVLRV
jgi:beta-lactamase superfamily II metal-dependent hydrolase